MNENKLDWLAISIIKLLVLFVLTVATYLIGCVLQASIGIAG